jgi:thiol-disulfide isomerase/thioredoxin/Flp pilus assembly protein TadD
MFRRINLVCFLVALYGCGEASKTPAESSKNAVRETPEALKPLAVDHTTQAADNAGVAAADADEMPDASTTAGDSDVRGDALAASTKPSADEATDDEQDIEEETGPTVEQAFAAAQKAANSGNIKRALAELEKALPGNPEDARLLGVLAKVTYTLAMSDRQKPDYSQYIKAAEYVRRALKVDPTLGDNPGFRDLAATVYYNEACALAIGKQTADAMTALRAAMDAGFADFVQIEKDTDLESIRALPEFSELFTKAREAFREQLEPGIEEMFAATRAFDFDFELTDIEGNSIAKADFKGKVLIVDVWGTWCPPCRAEVPHFVELVKKHNASGLEIVGLNKEGADDNADLRKVQKFHKENGMNYRCALMKLDVRDDIINQIPNMEGYPTTLFFDRTGKVRVMVTGARDFETLDMIVTRLLEEKSEGAGS